MLPCSSPPVLRRIEPPRAAASSGALLLLLALSGVASLLGRPRGPAALGALVLCEAGAAPLAGVWRWAEQGFGRDLPGEETHDR